jgi:hypothetical protein
MTLATGDGSLFLLDVTGLALLVVGHHERWLWAIGLEGMTIHTGLVFGTFAFHQFSVFVDMVANSTVVDSGFVVMIVMVKSAYGALQLPKGFYIEVCIVLRKSRNTAKRDKEHDSAESEVSV